MKFFGKKGAFPINVQSIPFKTIIIIALSMLLLIFLIIIVKSLGGILAIS